MTICIQSPVEAFRRQWWIEATLEEIDLVPPKLDTLQRRHQYRDLQRIRTSAESLNWQGNVETMTLDDWFNFWEIEWENVKAAEEDEEPTSGGGEEGGEFAEAMKKDSRDQT